MRTPHKRLSIGVLALVAAGSMVFAAAALAHGRGGNHGRHGNDHGDHVITRNLVPSKTTANGGPTVFTIKPGGADWFLSRGTAKLRSDGSIKVRVRGLTLANNVVPPNFVVSASLFCNGDTGKPVGTTAAVPLPATGNATMTGQFTLPQVCYAPTVMVHPNNNLTTYIAITGFTLTQNDDD
jgi:hypothetical protein